MDLALVVKRQSRRVTLAGREASSVAISRWVKRKLSTGLLFESRSVVGNGIAIDCMTGLLNKGRITR